MKSQPNSSFQLKRRVDFIRMLTTTVTFLIMLKIAKWHFILSGNWIIARRLIIPGKNTAWLNGNNKIESKMNSINLYLFLPAVSVAAKPPASVSICPINRVLRCWKCLTISTNIGGNKSFFAFKLKNFSLSKRLPNYWIPSSTATSTSRTKKKTIYRKELECNSFFSLNLIQAEKNERMKWIHSRPNLNMILGRNDNRMECIV